MKEHVNAMWWSNKFGDLVYFPGGELESGALDTEKACKEAGIELIIIPWRAYMGLKDWMLENDRDRVVISNREEDLKVIHRLLDIQEKMVK